MLIRVIFLELYSICYHLLVFILWLVILGYLEQETYCYVDWCHFFLNNTMCYHFLVFIIWLVILGHLEREAYCCGVLCRLVWSMSRISTRCVQSRAAIQVTILAPKFLFSLQLNRLRLFYWNILEETELLTFLLTENIWQNVRKWIT